MKSPPELWSEVSEVEGLAKHLGELGEIRIRELDPERTVAWEGEAARGTVELEAAGWGTKVTLTAAVPDAVIAEPEPAVAEPESEPEPEPEPEAMEPEPPPIEPVQGPRAEGFISRWLFRRRREGPEPEPDRAVEPPQPPEPEPAPEPPAVELAPVEPDPEPDAEPSIDEDRVRGVLERALDNLGSAHHRPFSRG